MIARIKTGANVYGLVAYLWGPGDKDEHTNHRTLASSKGLFVDFDALYQTDQARADALSKWADTIERLPAKHVWHCSVRVAPDESLTDSQWEEVAQSVVQAAGISDGPGDPDGCQWVAMAHDGYDGNHIHIAAVLIRPDGSKANTYNDFVKAGEVCRNFESRWHLTRTAARTGNAHQRPSRKDIHRGNKDEVGLDRAAVRRVALRAAAESDGWEDFRQRLEADGIPVIARMSTIIDGQVTGYAVEIPATGERVAGGKLGRGLSYNKLTEAWTALALGPAAADELRTLRSQRPNPDQSALARALRHAAIQPDPDSADALGTVLQVGARYSPHLRTAADEWERARYYAGRHARTKAGKTIRLALKHLERGHYEAALIVAAIELASAVSRALATNVAYLSQKRAADRAIESLQQERHRLEAQASAMPHRTPPQLDQTRTDIGRTDVPDHGRTRS